jgi:hypothetical protein
MEIDILFITTKVRHWTSCWACWIHSKLSFYLFKIRFNYYADLTILPSAPRSGCRQGRDVRHLPPLDFFWKKSKFMKENTPNIKTKIKNIFLNLINSAKLGILKSWIKMGINCRCKLNITITLDTPHLLSFVKHGISIIAIVYFTRFKEGTAPVR